MKDVDPTGRVSLSRIRESLFFRIVSATGGDIALTSLVFAKAHHTVDAEMFYLSSSARKVAGICLEASQRIHAAALPDLDIPLVDIERLVPDADLGCRFYSHLKMLSISGFVFSTRPSYRTGPCLPGLCPLSEPSCSL